MQCCMAAFAWLVASPATSPLMPLMLQLCAVVISATKDGVKFSTSGDVGTANITVRQNTSADKVRRQLILPQGCICERPVPLGASHHQPAVSSVQPDPSCLLVMPALPSIDDLHAGVYMQFSGAHMSCMHRIIPDERTTHNAFPKQHSISWIIAG